MNTELNLNVKRKKLAHTCIGQRQNKGHSEWCGHFAKICESDQTTHTLSRVVPGLYQILKGGGCHILETWFWRGYTGKGLYTRHHIQYMYKQFFVTTQCKKSVGHIYITQTDLTCIGRDLGLAHCMKFLEFKINLVVVLHVVMCSSHKVIRNYKRKKTTQSRL